MKKTHILIAATVTTVTILTLVVVIRAAESGPWDTVGGIRTDGILSVDDKEPPPPPPEPSIFDTLQTFTGRITSMTAAPIGGYTCIAGEIKLNVRTGFSRGSLIPVRELSEEKPNIDALLLLIGAPVKVSLNTSAGAKTVLIPALEGERFKAVMGILHAAKLTNRDVSFQVPTVSVPNCPSAFYVADATFH